MVLTASALDGNLQAIDQLRTARTSKELTRAGTSWARANGFDHWIYGVGAPATPFLFGTFPAAWKQSACNETEFCHPLLTVAERTQTPVVWDLGSPSGLCSLLTVTRQRLIQESLECGIRSGISIPFSSANGRGNCVVALSNDRSIDSRTRYRQEPMAVVFSLYFQQALTRVMGEEIFAPKYAALAPRELECLQWAAQGKTSVEIAGILSLSAATVNFHLSNTARKLGTKGRYRTIHQAFKLGILES